MRNSLVMTLVVMVILGVAGGASAEERIATYGENAGGQFVDGLKESVTSPAELPKEMVETGKENPLLGVTVGTIKGATSTAQQATDGALKVGTFIAPEKEEAEQESQNLPIEQRLGQGIQKSATGWTEVPKEIYETVKENPAEAVTLAPIRGAREATSETVEGGLQTGTFFVPESSQTTHTK